MRIETYLNAMVSVAIELWIVKLGTCEFERRLRQYHTFRARILRMDARKDAALDNLLALKDADFEEMYTIIIRQEKLIAEKDAEIAKLNNDKVTFLWNSI